MKYLSDDQLPPRLNVTGAMAVYLFLEHSHSPAWLYGVWGALYAIAFAHFIIIRARGTSVKLKELQ